MWLWNCGPFQKYSADIPLHSPSIVFYGFELKQFFVKSFALLNEYGNPFYLSLNAGQTVLLSIWRIKKKVNYLISASDWPKSKKNKTVKKLLWFVRLFMAKKTVGCIHKIGRQTLRENGIWTNEWKRIVSAGWKI